MTRTVLVKPSAGQCMLVHALGTRLDVRFPMVDITMDRPEGTDNLRIAFEDGASIELQGIFRERADAPAFEADGHILSRREFLEHYAPGQNIEQDALPSVHLRNCHSMEIDDAIDAPLLSGLDRLGPVTDSVTNTKDAVSGFLDNNAPLDNLLASVHALPAVTEPVKHIPQTDTMPFQNNDQIHSPEVDLAIVILRTSLENG